MGELYMRSELTIIGDNELDFISLVKKMRKAQKIYSETFPTGYGCYAPTELESEVDEYLKKMES